MPTIPEQLSKMLANSKGKPDANLAQDSNNLGGIPAEDWATKKWVQEYHDNKEEKLKEYIDEQDNAKLEEAKSYTDSMIRNQDFSDFAKDTDISALETKLNKKIEDGDISQKNYTDQEIEKVVGDVNTNFGDTGKAIQGLNDKISELKTKDTSIEKSITELKNSDTSINTKISNLQNKDTLLDKEIADLKAKDESHDKSITNANTNISSLNTKYNDLFTSVSNGKRKIAEAITDKGVATSADSSFDVMAINIRSITTGGGSIPSGYIDTSMGTAIASDIKLGKVAFSKGSIIIGTHIEEGFNTSDATATPYDILQGKTAYTANGKITGQLVVKDTGSGELEPSYSPGNITPIYGTRANDVSQLIYDVSEINNSNINSYCIEPLVDKNDKIIKIYALAVERSTNNIIIYEKNPDSNKFIEKNRTTIYLEDEGDTIRAIGCTNLNVEYPYIILCTWKNNVYITPIEVKNNEIAIQTSFCEKGDKMNIKNATTLDAIIQVNLSGSQFAIILNGDGAYPKQQTAFYYVNIRPSIFKYTAKLIKTIEVLDCYKTGGAYWANDDLFVNPQVFSNVREIYFYYFCRYYNPETETYTEPVISEFIQKGGVIAITPNGKRILGYDLEPIENSNNSSIKWWVIEIEIDIVHFNVIASKLIHLPEGMLPNDEFSRSVCIQIQFQI